MRKELVIASRDIKTNAGMQRQVIKEFTCTQNIDLRSPVSAGLEQRGKEFGCLSSLRVGQINAKANDDICAAGVQAGGNALGQVFSIHLLFRGAKDLGLELGFLPRLE